MKKKVLPINPMPDGTCRTIKSQYYKNSLGNFIRGGGELQDKDLLDCYNQTFVTDVAYTLTTRVNSSNHYWVYEIVYSTSD